jgi:prevent-host-death family protein
MDTYTVSEAKAQLSALIERVLRGERVAIGRRGKPEVVLTTVDDDPTPRQLGGYDGPFRMDEDFDAPLPEALQAAFEG